jgi:hypothetical protein
MKQGAAPLRAAREPLGGISPVSALCRVIPPFVDGGAQVFGRRRSKPSWAVLATRRPS